MSRAQTTSFLTPAVYVGGVVTFRKLTRGMRRIAFDHTRAPGVSRTGRIELGALYTAKRNSAH